MIITGKRCSKCGAQRELSEYNKKKAAPDGLRSECRICQSIDYDERKRTGKIKGNEVGYKTFKIKYGVAYTTIRDWLIREYDNNKAPYWQIGQVPVSERKALVAKYKRYKKKKGSYKTGVSK
jgi:hypothetical protein